MMKLLDYVHLDLAYTVQNNFLDYTGIKMYS